MSLIKYIAEKKLENEAEIIFFGGSFNPWHKGHTNCIKLASKTAAIIIIPDHNPFKEVTEFNEKLTSESQLQEIAKKHSTGIYLGFSKQNKANPTYTWINEVQQKYPSMKLSLLMGFDSFMSIDKWFKSEELLTLLHSIYIASRLDNDEIKNKQIKHLESVVPKLKISFLGNHDQEHLSSTQIRKNEQ